MLKSHTQTLAHTHIHVSATQAETTALKPQLSPICCHEKRGVSDHLDSSEAQGDHNAMTQGEALLGIGQVMSGTSARRKGRERERERERERDKSIDR